MARRKRLSFDTLGLETKAADVAGPETGAARGAAPLAGGVAPARPAPIAQVVGDSSAQAALAALTAELEEARATGRLLLRLKLDQIDESHLARDRVSADPQDMEDLIASIRARGQQMPVEVVALGQGRFGLISGWRRLRAVRHLLAETGEARFAHVLALPRTPETMAEAYRAMVEENEIRAGLSYYERARIAGLAAEAGVHADARAAIAGLFAAASRAKRSKIGSFLTIWQRLDSRLRFGPAIPERLGLQLARALEGEPGFAARLADRLRKAAPDSAEAELALLEKALRAREGGGSEAAVAPESAPARPAPETSPTAAETGAPEPTPAPTPHREEVIPGIWVETTGGFQRASITLSGARVDGPLRARLVDWLRAQAR